MPCINDRVKANHTVMQTDGYRTKVGEIDFGPLTNIGKLSYQTLTKWQAQPHNVP